MKISGFVRATDRKAEILRFCLVGGVAAAIQYGTYLIFLSFCGINAEISTILSYLISFAVNFIMSSLFTFRTPLLRSKILPFSACHVLNLGAQTALVALFSAAISPKMALLPAMAICVPCNYIMVRYALK